MKTDLSEIMRSEETQLATLNKLVEESIKEEELISKKLAELEPDTPNNIGDKISDFVAEFGGSWKFILSFIFILFFWILINISALNASPFDPYPFILLNLVLSCIAALQAPIIMMSQNRQEEKDRQRSRSDFMVNLKAEMEVRGLHKKMDLLMAEQMQNLFKIQQAQMEILNELKDSIQKNNEKF